MNRLNPRCLAAGLLLSVLLLGGCPAVTIDLPGASITIPGVGVITLELVNDTGFEVDPRIIFDDDSGFWASLVPADELATGTLAPGQVRSFDIDCDELGLVRSDGAEQFVGGFIYTADPSKTIERDDEYDCGDLIQFQFIGDADSFDVIVAVNGVVVG